jgi:hypothetical protein
LGFPGFIEPPVPRPAPGRPLPPRPPQAACPAAHPFDASLLVAPNNAPRPPREASYTFRNNGFVEVAGAGRIAYPSTTRRTVTDVRALDEEGNFEFDVDAEVGGPDTATTYRVLNAGPTPDRGLYIARIRTGGDVFSPEPAVLLMPFPPPELGTNLEDEAARAAGPNYRSAGTDPTTGFTLAIEAHLDGKERVDACGEWVDAWRIAIDAGRIVGPGKDLTFDGSFNIATQYGGLVVQDDIHMEGTDGLVALESHNRASINSVPLTPR